MNIHLRVDNHGIPLAVNVSPANVHDTKGSAPVLCQLPSHGLSRDVAQSHIMTCTIMMLACTNLI